MRKSLITLTLLMLMAVSGMAQEYPDVQNTIFFGGLKHEGSTAPVYGGGGAVAGSNFWIFGYTALTNDTGEVGDPAVSTPLGAEIAYLYPVNEKLKIGITISPLTIDWANISGAKWNTYINNTTGAVGSYKFHPHFGIAGWFKYKWNFGDTAFETEGGDRTAWALVGYYAL